MKSKPDLDRWRRGGLHILRGLASYDEQLALADVCRGIVAAAPFVRPHMRDGTPFHCDISGAGPSVFFAAKQRGYYYAKAHPVTGKPWPALPSQPRELARRAIDNSGETPFGFDTLLLNRYRAADGERLGLHIDEDEDDLEAPIVTISIGADCEFLIGGARRDDPVGSVVLSSGDAIVMARAAWSWHHAVKRVMPVLGSPIAHGTRLAISVRKVAAGPIQ